MNKYSELMEKIELTQEMRDKILNNINEQNVQNHKKTVHFMHYKTFVALAACFAILLIGTMTVQNLGKSNPGNRAPDTPLEDNPIVTVSSVKELSDIVGFSVTDIPSLAVEASNISYTAYDQKLAEIDYILTTQNIYFRKSIGSEDNSGDYSEYALSKELDIESCHVTVKGNKGNYNKAIWTNGKYSYSIGVDHGVSLENLQKIIKEAIQNS